MDARPGARGLGLPASGERDLCGLGGPVGPEELLARARIVEEYRLTGFAQKRRDKGDEDENKEGGRREEEPDREASKTSSLPPAESSHSYTNFGVGFGFLHKP